MSEKRNEIIEQQRKARQEFINLKKMQNGEKEPELMPCEVEIKPKTFKEKAVNFWYHYKFSAILCLMLAIFITIATVQCASREKYDFKVMYFTFNPVLDVQLEKAETYFEKYAKDIDNNGEVNVKIINCSLSDDSNNISRNAVFSKVQSIISAEYTTVLYIIDPKAKQYFENALGYSIFAEEPIVLSDDFYNISELKEKDLMLGIRIIKNTTFEGEEKAEEAYKEGNRVLQEIKKLSK